MHVLVTRPVPENQATARKLNAMGFETVLEPLFETQHIPVDLPDLADFQAVIFTSPRAVSRYEGDITDAPVFCVGDRTALVARKKGFDNVLSADGDARDLAALIRSKLLPEKGPLLRLGAEMEYDALVENLQNAGFSIASIISYRMLAREELSEGTIALLRDKKLDGVLFYSPHSADHFKHLIQHAGLAEACRTLAAWCISDKTAKMLQDLPFRTVAAAAKPTQNALLDLLKTDKKP